MLEWGNFRVLLPLGGRFEELEEQEYGTRIGPVSALLLADNGYVSSNPVEWINNFRPEIILLRASGKDRSGMPSREMLEALEVYILLRTDLNGWIEITSDGERMWVDVERKQGEREM